LFEVVPSVESAAMNVDFFGGAFVPTVDILLLD
jgi:hypothetical protein